MTALPPGILSVRNPSPEDPDPRLGRSPSSSTLSSSMVSSSSPTSQERELEREREKGSTSHYFAYGSNLSLHQMRARCPGSTYYGVGRLPGWTWIINQRGYANVIPCCPRGKEEEEQEEDCVWGLLYELRGEDEGNLDRAEGVPYVYEKEILDVVVVVADDTTCLPPPRSYSNEASKETGMSESGKPDSPTALKRVLNSEEGVKSGAEVKTVRALVYIDRHRVEPGACAEEYVARMNRGIRDALRLGVDVDYVERVMRPFVGADDGGGEGDEEVYDPFL